MLNLPRVTSFIEDEAQEARVIAPLLRSAIDAPLQVPPIGCRLIAGLLLR